MRCGVVDAHDDDGKAPGHTAGRSGDRDGRYAGAAEDAVWVDAARRGDDQAFGRLFDRWFDPVYDVAWRIVRNPDTAAEVAQDVFLVAWQGLDDLAQQASFGGWVRRIARNRALNRLDRERRSIPDGEQAAAALDRSAPEVDLTAALGELEQRELVWAAASALGERDASLLDLHLRHGFGAGEIADELGVTTNNAHQLLHRLKGKLGGAIRSWVLWRGGRDCPELDRAISAAGLTTFGPEAVSVIGRHAQGCDTCSESQQLRLAPEALFAAMPIAAAPPLLKAEAAAALGQAGVPMAGSTTTAADLAGGREPGGADAGGADGPRGDGGGGDAGPADAGGGSGGGDPGDAGAGTRSRRRTLVTAGLVALVAVVALVVLLTGGDDSGTTEAADAPATSTTQPPVTDLAPTSAAPAVAPDTPAPAPDPTASGVTVTTVEPGGAGPAPDPGTTGDPGLPSPSQDPAPVPPAPDPPTIGGFRATLAAPCGATPSDGEREVGLAWQSTGADSATIAGPGGTTTHPASGSAIRCLREPSGSTFTLTVTGPGGSASATATVP